MRERQSDGEASTMSVTLWTSWILTRVDFESTKRIGSNMFHALEML